MNDDGDQIINTSDTSLDPEINKSRREFLKNAAVLGTGIAFGGIIAADAAELVNDANAAELINDAAPYAVPINLKVNGKLHSLKVDPRASLLDAFREQLGLTGTKKGCDQGQCGACTVLVDGVRINSCLTFAMMYQGKEIKTIEGLSQGFTSSLHPMQEAFIKHDGFQCGYCTPGQICSAVAMIDEVKNGQACYLTETLTNINSRPILNEEEIKERMSGNLCRCGAYAGIVAAVQEAAKNAMGA